MTLKDIGDQISLDRQMWGRKHQQELETVSTNPEIAYCIRKLIEDACRHPQSTQGDPRKAVKHSLALASMGNFRLGLLIGILLYKDKAAPENLVELAPLALEAAGTTDCDFCEGDGIHCMHCGFRKKACTCGHLYSPVKCDVCDGTGRIPLNHELGVSKIERA